MKLIETVDGLLRNPEAVYQAASGERPARVAGQLLLIFAVTAGAYGLVMGSYRWLHPEYRFGNFEVASDQGWVTRGTVEGINFDTATVYTRGNIRAQGARTVRFNLWRPTDEYPIEAIGEEGDYTTIKLAPGAVLREESPWKLTLLVVLKVPALFALTLLVTAPALYVMNLALDGRMRFLPVFTVSCFGLAATGVMLAVLAPISALFTVVTEAYHFMVTLHIITFLIAGAYGLRALYRGYMALMPDARLKAKASVLLCLMLYALVGSQLVWTLKPFLGTPYQAALPPFRMSSGNIYVSFCQALGRWGAPSRSRTAVETEWRDRTSGLGSASADRTLPPAEGRPARMSSAAETVPGTS